MIYFDNAATSFPKPPEVSHAMYRCLTEFGGNPGRSGHKMSVSAAKIIYNMREKVAQFFGFNDPERVILTKNCTEALNVAIFGIMKNGGNAVISNFEHNSVVRPLEYLRKSGICDYKIAKASLENPEILVREFEKLIDSNTKMILCTHASNVTGKIPPINQISRICKRNGIVFCLDASQTAGIVKIDMDKNGIDILCCPGHKSLLGPTGTGLLLVQKNIELSPFIFGGTGSISVNLDMPNFYPDMLESGTVNVVGAAGLIAGISYINRIGIDNIYEHEIKMAERFYKRLYDMPKIQLYSGIPLKNTSVPTISFNVKGKTCTEVSEILDENNIAVRSGLHCAPLAHRFIGTGEMGTVRASFSNFNTINQIDYACKVLDSI